MTAAIGWAIVGAIGTTFLSVTGKIAFECSQRDAERRGTAAALAGEIGAYIDNLNPDVAAPAYRALAAFDREARVKKLAAFPPLPTGHPAYDKLSEKIGLLPPHLVREISRL